MAFHLGLVGLLPVIGVPFGLAAVALFVRARLRRNREWNPAEHYLEWGAGFAVTGLAFTLISIALVTAIQLQAHSSHRTFSLDFE
jgi:hypothetical protein